MKASRRPSGASATSWSTMRDTGSGSAAATASKAAAIATIWASFIGVAYQPSRRTCLRELGLGEALPGRIIIRLGMVEREAGRPVGPAAFDHEGHRPVDPVRLQLGLARALPAGDVGPVPGHQIVEAHPAGREAVRLGVI